MLPDPALSLTIPSIHDSTVLDCRVYHPQSLSANPRSPAWHRHAAILAHPYAPLGGCFDDPILAEATAQLLRSGYLVATFNFRGAGGSAGRTSWTAKPEGEDYISVIGFIVYYIHYLDPFRQSLSTKDGSLDPTVVPEPRPRHPSLIIGGYSYGSIVTMQLPPLDAVLARFASPIAGSPASQIRLRAQHLATQYNDVLRSARDAMSNKRTRSHGSTNIRVGGDEEPGSPRRSIDGERRSFSVEAEKVRRSLQLFKRNKDRPSDHMPGETTAAGGEHGESLHEERLSPLTDLTIPRQSYLLISPVQGIAKHLANMSFLSSSSSHAHQSQQDAAETKLIENPTLAVYGDHDGFVAASKLRAWASRLRAPEGSKFQAIEVAYGGHFWVEEGVMMELRRAVERFAASQLAEP